MMKVINTRRTGKSIQIEQMKLALIMNGASITSTIAKGLLTEYFELDGNKHVFVSLANNEQGD